MASVNKVIIIGNLGRDPEVRALPSGEAIANIAVATSWTQKDRNTGESKEFTEWHRIAFFGRLAEIVGTYLRKGSSVYVEGRLQTRKYTDKDGIERYATDIIAENMQMLGGPANANRDASQQTETQSPAPAPVASKPAPAPKAPAAKSPAKRGAAKPAATPAPVPAGEPETAWDEGTRG